MKKIITFILITLFIAQYSFSQESNNKNTLSISIGPSFPVGDFSSTNPSNNLAGYAKTGESLNLSFDHKLNKHFGIVGTLYGLRNGLNTKAAANQFSSYPFFSNIGFGPRYYSNWTLDKRSWYSESLLVGASEESPLTKNNRFSFIAKAMVGIAYVQYPKLNANSKTDTSYATATQSSASSFGLSYLAEVGIKYKLNNTTNLQFNVGYFGTAQISFKNIHQQITATNGGIIVPKIYSFSNSLLPIISESSTGTNKQTINSININFGILFSL